MERTKTLIQHIASLIVARQNCLNSSNTEWYLKHTDRLETLARDFLPSGSGIDSGTKIDLDASNGDKVVFTTAFHHMTDHGYYDGWSEHVVTIRPAFDGFYVTVSGRNRNDIKEYLADTFYTALRSDIVESADGYRWLKHGETVAA